MTEAKHTPGPWFVQPPNESTPSIWIGSKSDNSIAKIEACEKTDDADDTERVDEIDFANARLIAAAPDMLAALEEIVSYVAPTLKSEFRLSQGLAAALQHSRAAIAKAKGAS